MTNSTLTPLGNQLAHFMETIKIHEANSRDKTSPETYHVPNMGHVVSSLYEQLRNASENIEEHLLLQKAIRRFYDRNIQFIDHQAPNGLAEELAIELTLAEYVANDSIEIAKITEINQLVREAYQVYWQIAEQSPNISRATTRKWVLDIMAVRSEQILNDPTRLLTFAHFAQNYFSDKVSVERHIASQERVAPDTHQTIIYIAVHRALLKSDDATIRSMLLDLHGATLSNTESLVALNQRYDALFELKTTDNLTRLISKNGAPFRIIRQAFFEDNASAKPQLLAEPSHLASYLSQTIEDAYSDTRSTLNRGIIKSIIFLLLTKAVIGVFIEIPYDIAVHGEIAIWPLIINLFFPAAFIALTTWTLKMPTSTNTDRIIRTIESIIYQQTETPKSAELRINRESRHSKIFSVAYAILFASVVAGVVYGLTLLNFNLVQILIFVIFLSTAAFLGYRLSLQVKALEVVGSEQNILEILRDFIYMPFIFIGHQISYRYAKINIIARLLDNAIELPLKTTLRLVRQWSSFLSNKKDEIL